MSNLVVNVLYVTREFFFDDKTTSDVRADGRAAAADFSDFLTRHPVRSDSFLTKTKEQIKAEIFLLQEREGK